MLLEAAHWGSHRPTSGQADGGELRRHRLVQQDEGDVVWAGGLALGALDIQRVHHNLGGSPQLDLLLLVLDDGNLIHTRASAMGGAPLLWPAASGSMRGGQEVSAIGLAIVNPITQ